MGSSDARIYKPRRDGSGAASAWNFRWLDEQTAAVFLELAPQSEVADGNGYNRFDWSGKENPGARSINVKLGVPDLTAIIAVLEGRRDQLAPNGSIFHRTRSGGNKVVSLAWYDQFGGYGLKVSAQDASGHQSGPIKHGITIEEAILLRELLTTALVRMHGW